MHARVIITEGGAAVSVPHLIVGESEEDVIQQARLLMRSTIESVVENSSGRLSLDEQELQSSLEEGCWWSDEGNEPFTVLIDQPESITTVTPS